MILWVTMSQAEIDLTLGTEDGDHFLLLASFCVTLVGEDSITGSPL